MIFLFQSLFLFISFLPLCHQRSEANEQNFIRKNPSQYINHELWESVQDYLMPDDHPIKSKLDQIFFSSRALANPETMLAAGFEDAEPQHHTQIIVTRHPEIRGYVIKAYLDSQQYHSNKPEHYFWIKRITGARLIQEYITTHNYAHLFKVPQKWMYLLPDEPSPPLNSLRKMFILVEKDMNIFSSKRNEILWGSKWVTKKLLKGLYKLTTDLGFFDCAKPSNCPFSIDGRVAFVDTQSYGRNYVKYYKLTPYLSPHMQYYWKKLIKNGMTN